MKKLVLALAVMVLVSLNVRAATRWIPVTADTWQWQLTGTIDTKYNVNVYDIDLFDTPVTTINALHSQGRKVVCYFSAGSAENWRPDYSKFLPADLGNDLSGWPGERYVDTRSANVRSIMVARMVLAVSKGCDGIEPDNVDAYENKPGLPLTASTQLNYNQFLADEAHSHNLAVALKNDVDQVTELAVAFDFAINEQCHQYNECGVYSIFINANKPVFNAEYAKKAPAKRPAMCNTAVEQHFQTLILPLDLNDKFRYSCDL